MYIQENQAVTTALNLVKLLHPRGTWHSTPLTDPTVYTLLDVPSELLLQVLLESLPYASWGGVVLFLLHYSVQHKTSKLKWDQSFEGSYAFALKDGCPGNRSEHMWGVKFCQGEVSPDFPLPLKAQRECKLHRGRDHICRTHRSNA